MIKKYTYRNLTWIDVESPTEGDASSLVTTYGLHPTIGDELLSPTWKPKVDVTQKYLFMALQIPVRSNSRTKQQNVIEKEIDFVIGKDFIITSHKEEVEPLHSFAKALETNSILDKSGRDILGDEKAGNHAGLLFYYIMKRIYAHMTVDLENIKDALSNAEKHIFLGHERKMVEVLSDLSRDLIDFKQTARLHREVLESFQNDVPEDFFGDHFKEMIGEILVEYSSIHEKISNCRELVGDLRETNDSLLSTKQNESMRSVSILAFITLPLSLITSIFSMNTTHSLIIGLPYDFEIIMAIMAISTLAMLYYFKRKGWL